MMTSPVQARASSRLSIRWSRVLSQTQDVLLIAVTSVFIAVHIQNLLNGHFTSIPFAAENIVLIGLYLSRRKSRATSSRPLDWVYATIGGWGTLTLQLHESGPLWLETSGFVLQLTGLSLATVCFLGLGRSFGVVAANRGLKTSGPYRFVRHPIYACHFITNTGFVMVNPSWVNVAIFMIVLVAQIMRIRAEERVLTESGDYANYAAQVRYRLIPGVY